VPLDLARFTRSAFTLSAFAPSRSVS